MNSSIDKKVLRKMEQMEKMISEANMDPNVINANFWKPKVGSYIVGIYLKRQTINDIYSKPRDVIIIKDRNGVLWSIWVTAHLKKLLEELKPKSGDIIGIKRIKNYGRWQRYIVRILRTEE